MFLTDLKKGEEAKVVAIHSGKNLKGRLYSMGIIKGSKIVVEQYSPGRGTIKIAVDDANCYALRRGEAQKVEVQKLEEA